MILFAWTTSERGFHREKLSDLVKTSCSFFMARLNLSCSFNILFQHVHEMYTMKNRSKIGAKSTKVNVNFLLWRLGNLLKKE